MNVVLLGVLAGCMNESKEAWAAALKKTIKPQLLDVNVTAFEKGYAMSPGKQV